MRKYLIPIIIFAIFATSHIKVVSQINEKQLYFITPYSKDTLSGTASIRFFTNISNFITEGDFVLQLFKNTCDMSKAEYFGDVGVIKLIKDKEYYEFSWNTLLPILNEGSASNGSYCLVINSPTFKDTYTIVQNYQEITINNTLNTPPNIKDDLKDITLKLGEKVSLQISATDEDNDSLKYFIENQPDFININNSTGTITNSKPLNSQGVYELKLKVEDKEKLSSTESIFLNIVHPDSGLSENTLSLSKDINKSIISKNLDLDMIVKTFENYDDVDVILVDSKGKTAKSYNQKKGNLKLTVDLAKESIEDGEYKINLILKKEGKPILAKSYKDVLIFKDAFNLYKKSNELISVYDLYPKAGEIYENYDKRVLGKFKSSSGTTPEIKVFMNKVDISEDCEILVDEFECLASQEFRTGKHVITVDFSNKTSRHIASTYFNVVFDDNGGSINIGDDQVILIGDYEVSINALVIFGIILTFSFIIIFVPWFLYYSWVRKSEKKHRHNPYLPPNHRNQPTRQPVNNKQPKMKPTPPPSGNYNIGEQSLGQAPQQAYMPNNSQAPSYTPPTHLPYSYTDEEIPDWLKDPSSGSKPVNVSGEKYVSPPKPVDKSKSEPYGYDQYGQGSQY